MSLLDDFLEGADPPAVVPQKSPEQPAHAEREHVDCSASVTERFWNCAGSIELARGLPNVGNIHTERGTAAHELGETCLRKWEDSWIYMGDVFNGIEIDERIISGVQMYLDTCREYMGEGWTYSIEERVYLDKLDPPIPMSGTADFRSYNARLRRLVIVDYKNGVGNVVIEGNKQARYYALGTFFGLPPGTTVDTIEMIIVQPNAITGRKVKRESIELYELLDWGYELVERARATLLPNAEIKSGDWCKWCPARGMCPTRTEAVLAEAHIDFGDILLPALTTNANCTSSRVVLTEEQLGRLYNAIPQIKKLLEDVENAVQSSWANNFPVPHTKVVPTEGNRAWEKARTEDELVEFMVETLGIPREKTLAKPKVIPITQAEGLYVEKNYVKGKVTKQALKDQFNTDSKPVITRPSGTKIVSETDPREAIASATSEFLPLLPAAAISAG